MKTTERKKPKNEPYYRFFVNRNLAFGCPNQYGYRVKINEKEILPLYKAFKAAIVKGTSRPASFPATDKERLLFEHILFSMPRFDYMTQAERTEYIVRRASRSSLYRENLLKFSRAAVKKNLDEAYLLVKVKAELHFEKKKG